MRERLGLDLSKVTHGAMIIRAPGIGNGKSSTVSGTLAKKPLICSARSFTMSVYHEPAFPASLMFVFVSVSISVCVIWRFLVVVQYAVGSSER